MSQNNGWVPTSTGGKVHDVTLSPGTEENLIKIIAKRRGIPADEAQLYVDAFKREGLSEFDTNLARLAQFGAIAKNIPQSAADPIQSVLAQRLAYSAIQTNPPQSETTAEKLLAIGAALPPVEDSSVRKELEELKNQLSERDKADLRKFQQDILTRVETLQKQQDEKNTAVLNAIESIKKGGTPMAGEPIAVTQQVAQEMAKATAIREELAKADGFAESVSGRNGNSGRCAQTCSRCGLYGERPYDGRRI